MKVVVLHVFRGRGKSPSFFVLNVSVNAVLLLWRRRVGSLCCDSAEEAKTLIPSIADKIDDEILQELLDQMAKLQG